MTPAEEERHLVRVADHLLSKFPHATTDTVSAPVAQAYARFDGKRIREYVPLLVERRATAALTKNENDSAKRSWKQSSEAVSDSRVCSGPVKISPA